MPRIKWGIWHAYLAFIHDDCYESAAFAGVLVPFLVRPIGIIAILSIEEFNQICKVVLSVRNRGYFFNGSLYKEKRVPPMGTQDNATEGNEKFYFIEQVENTVVKRQSLKVFVTPQKFQPLLSDFLSSAH